MKKYDLPKWAFVKIKLDYNASSDIRKKKVFNMKKNSSDLCKLIKKSLNKNKAEEITIINLKKKTSIADYMIICTGTSNRHIIALSNYLNEDLKDLNLNMMNVEGKKW